MSKKTIVQEFHDIIDRDRRVGDVLIADTVAECLMLAASRFDKLETIINDKESITCD